MLLLHSNYVILKSCLTDEFSTRFADNSEAAYLFIAPPCTAAQNVSENLLDGFWQNVDKNGDVSLAAVVRSDGRILAWIGLHYRLDLHHVTVVSFGHHSMPFAVR